LQADTAQGRCNLGDHRDHVGQTRGHGDEIGGGDGGDQPQHDGSTAAQVVQPQVPQGYDQHKGPQRAQQAERGREEQRAAAGRQRQHGQGGDGQGCRGGQRIEQHRSQA